MSEAGIIANVGKTIDHVLLTKRDLALFEALHEHVVLSYAQVQNWYFTGRSPATLTNRLRKLEAQGWISRTRVEGLGDLALQVQLELFFSYLRRGGKYWPRPSQRWISLKDVLPLVPIS